jgi:hypothetical protein
MAKPKARRAIIREWMALAREKRQTGQQARLLQKPRSNGTACRAAAERRTT